MEGSLLQRGIGWYLTFDETVHELDLQSVNPGHFVGFSLGMIYVASPIDVIPDFIPMIGVVDDALVLKASTLAGGSIWDSVFS